MERNCLLQRFLRYVQIETTSQADAQGYPSSAGQIELGRLLVEELAAIGLADARQDRHGIVLATIPATVMQPAPTIALCCAPRHLARDERGWREAASHRALRWRRYRAAGGS